jgi:hypothetical protein
MAAWLVCEILYLLWGSFKKKTFIIHWSMMENDTNFGMLGISCHQSTNLSRKKDTRKCHQNRLTIGVS